MIFFFDNNLSIKIVAGLRGFGEDVTHLTENFPEDTADTVWLQTIGQEGWYLVTRDKNIIRNPSEKRALKENVVAARCFQKHLSHGEGVFYIYVDICDQIGKKIKIANDEEIMRLLVTMDRYRGGIRPYQILINDCLREQNLHEEYGTSSAMNQVKSIGIEAKLESLKYKKPVLLNRLEFR